MGAAVVSFEVMSVVARSRQVLCEGRLGDCEYDIELLECLPFAAKTVDVFTERTVPCNEKVASHSRDYQPSGLHKVRVVVLRLIQASQANASSLSSLSPSSQPLSVQHRGCPIR